MFNRKKMTKKELDHLAELVVNKLLINLGVIPFEEHKENSNKRSRNTDDEIDKLHQQILSNLIMGDSEYFISNEEMLIGELARLQTILMIYEDKEEYEKAAIILGKLRAIQHKLNHE